MESVLGRYRNLIILVGVLFLQVLGLAVQVKSGSHDMKDTRLIRIWAAGMLSPFERSVVWIQHGTGNVWHNYFYLRGVRAENRQLKDQIEQMRLQQVRLTEDAAQARRLQNLLAFKEQYVAKTVAAQVIGTSGMDSSRVIWIDKGKNEGIEPDMAVITADGIVGKVLMADSKLSLSQVLLINDQSSGVGVILGDSRLQGVLAGNVNGEVGLNGIMSDEEVPVGEKVLTSGGDQIFPKGLPVGVVSKVGRGKDLFLNIKIKPTADLSKLEEVLVLVEKQERLAITDNKTRVRAADILAQRLPSVPDKPAPDANAATKPADASSKPASNASAASQTVTPAVNSVPKPKTAVVPPTQQAVKPPSANQPATSSSVTVPPKRTVPQVSGQSQKTTDGSIVPVSKPASAPTTPAITEEKPAPTAPVQPTTQPPNDNNPN